MMLIKAITYCSRCGDRVALRRGDARSGANVGGFAYCPGCFPPLPRATGTNTRLLPTGLQNRK